MSLQTIAINLDPPSFPLYVGEISKGLLAIC